MRRQQEVVGRPYLPVFCQESMVLRVIVLAQAVAILLALAPGVVEDRWVRLGFTTLFVQWVALLSILLLCLFQRMMHRLKPKLLIPASLLILLLVTLLVSILAYHVLANWGWVTREGLGSFVINNLAIALVVGAMCIQLFVMHYERSERITAQSRAELDALQAKIRPHFLFNCLNMIAELTREDPVGAERALLNLSGLFRAALNAGEQSTLEEELQLSRQYIELEQWRLGDRLKISWDLPEQLPALTLPVLTLQPLLENAVHHGVEALPEGGRIIMKLHRSKDWLTLLIENPVGRSVASSAGNGVAIRNIQRRLELVYGEQAKVTHGPVDGLYRLKIVLPLAEEKGV